MTIVPPEYNSVKTPALEELQALGQWVTYRYPEKLPLDPHTGGNAKTNKPETWGSHAIACKAVKTFGHHGTGFVVTNDDPYAGIDCDDCREADTVEPVVLSWRKRFNSFSYVTPGKHGERFILRGKLKKAITPAPFIDPFEAYDHGRYFTLTDQHIEGTPGTIEDRQQELDDFYQVVMANRKTKERWNKELRQKIDALKTAGEGQRNSELAKVAFRAGVLIEKYGLRQGAIEAEIWKACEKNGLAADEPEQSRKTLSNQLQAGKDKAYQEYKPEPPGASNGNGNHRQQPIGEQSSGFNRTDLGNAERFAAQYRERVRWCEDWKSWLVFNGKCWEQDRTGQADRLAKATVRSIYQEAASEPDDVLRAKIAKHAIASESSSAVRAMLDRAKSELPARPDEFNTHLHLLNCKNGTLDLHTGELRPHNPADMLTRCLKIGYNPLAPCPKWLRFIHSIFADDLPLISFMQQALGMSISGDVSEQCLFICWGAGSNGKTTLHEVIRIVLEAYGLAANIETFQLHKGERINNDVAELYGARFVTADENTLGSRLNEAFIKKVTGKQPLRARRLHENEFQFMPECTIWLAVNHKPVVKDTTRGMWRRVHFIPFTVTIEGDQVDKHLGEKLLEEAEGILAWLVQGCIAWYRQGRLNVPKIVQEATQAYRAEMDLVARFLDERCELGPNQETGATKMYQAYKTWCEETGERWETQNSFGAHLTERGFRKERTNHGYVYRGVNLVNLSEPLSGNFHASDDTSQKSANKGSQGSQGSQNRRLARLFLESVRACPGWTITLDVAGEALLDAPEGCDEQDYEDRMKGVDLYYDDLVALLREEAQA